MASQQELDARAEALRWEEIQYKWMRKHLNDFDPSPANAAALGNYISRYGMSLSEASLDQAFLVLTSQGFKFTANGKSAGESQNNGLPRVPAYMLKINRLETRKDIRDLDPKIAREMVQRSRWRSVQG